MNIYIVLSSKEEGSEKAKLLNYKMFGFLPVFLNKKDAQEYAKEKNLPVIKVNTNKRRIK